ncbi:site-specific DNA-methyltransferase [Streptococcus zalophi]|uniref:Site-specific DNA-methyltransferase n=1 Tax=Streptococcus zalophi TaxID=640031 RepID=A0A934PA55_9STRE|nr:site-specific DNA-methyltransferase [Streptococcus zalophi]MBJ8349991.1 site-specific DNA-methyltransferase [Streptococcus zalophi]
MTEQFVERPHKNEKENAIQYVQLLLQQAREENRNEDIEKLEELVRLLHTKKYGLVWEEHAELVEEKMKTQIPVFVEDEGKKIVGNPESEDYNFLLEGDNLHSLHLLEKTHAGKIDVIYIDPPYNTGNKDFIYNDSYIVKEDSYRHSKWISFMEKRLKIARKLLSVAGVLFISIDDNEQSQLKLLCDEIFGESNYLNQISINSKVSAGASGGGEDKKLKKNIEYLLVYCKNSSILPPLKPIYKETELMTYVQKMKSEGKSFKYTNVLYEFDDLIPYKIIKDGTGNDIIIKKVNNYSILTVKAIAKLEEISEEEVYFKYYDKIMTTTNAQTSIRTRVWEATDNEDNMYMATYVPKSGKNKGKTTDLIFKGKQKVLVIWLKDTSQKLNNKIVKKERIGTFWDGFSWINVSKEGKIKFENGKKPINLIMQMLELTETKNSTILDFFAGSGTTGHAVAQLNKEDGGNRKYILCTNNENKIAEEVTYKRLSNIQEELPHNLKYFKTDFVDKTKFPDISLEFELLNYITTLVELEFGIDISNPSVEIILTEEHLERLLEEEQLKQGATLFIHPDVFIDTKEQEAISRLNITLQEIPDYFFGKELWSND